MGGRVVAKGCGRATPVGSTGWRPSATLTLFEREQARTPPLLERHTYPRRGKDPSLVRCQEWWE